MYVLLRISADLAQLLKIKDRLTFVSVDDRRLITVIVQLPEDGICI